MPYSLETLAALATILGAVISVLGLLQSRAWLVLTSLFFVVWRSRPASTPGASASPAMRLRR